MLYEVITDIGKSNSYPILVGAGGFRELQRNLKGENEMPLTPLGWRAQNTISMVAYWERVIDKFLEGITLEYRLNVAGQAIQFLRCCGAVARRCAAFFGHLRDALYLRGNAVCRSALFANGDRDFLDHLYGVSASFTDFLDGRVGFLRPADPL